MKRGRLVICMLALHFHAVSQTSIQLIVKNIGQHKIDKFDAFDLSENEIYSPAYKDTIILHFNNKKIDCFNLRYHDHDTMFRQQIWLDTGVIKIEAHINSTNLVIDTVINSPMYYKKILFEKKYAEFHKAHDTAALNDFLIKTYQEHIQDPFSLAAAKTYIDFNQNSKSNLLTFKKLFDKQVDKFTWFLIYPAVAERLNKILTVKNINLNNFSFIDKANKKVKLSLKGSEYYVFDCWFLACNPCIEQHKNIKAALSKLRNKKIELIGISIDKNIKSWNKYLLLNKYTWQNYLQSDEEKITEELSITNYPTYIVLNNNGDIIETYNSFSDVLKHFSIQE